MLRHFTNLTKHAVIVSSICFCLTGCSRQDKWQKNWPKVYKAGGVVRQEGKPLDQAIVLFFAKDGSSLGRASTDSEGRFRLTTFKDFDGVVEGEFEVSIEKNDWIPEGPANFAATGVMPPLKKVPRTAAKYGDSKTSGLTAVVHPKGPNKFEFDLDPNAK